MTKKEKALLVIKTLFCLAPPGAILEVYILTTENPGGLLPAVVTIVSFIATLIITWQITFWSIIREEIRKHNERVRQKELVVGSPVSGKARGCVVPNKENNDSEV